MRQIEEMAQLLAKTFFHKQNTEIEIFDEQGVLISSGVLYGTLLTLIGNGEINEAETLLFNELDTHYDEQFLLVAIKFYDKLNELTDEKLNECNFSRSEILDGLKEIKKLCEEKDI